MTKKLLAAALAVALGVAPTLALAAPSSAASWHSSKHNPFFGVPMSGTSADGNVFAGTMSVLGFIDSATGGTNAIALLNGTITDPTGKTSVVENQVVQLPVVAADPTCAILHLTLGPLDLNLLGLTVHLNQVVLNIDAQSGPGNLLGNLLCGIANLLNIGALGGALTTLLNNVAAVLAGLGL
jgi:hypothetical protein